MSHWRELVASCVLGGRWLTAMDVAQPAAKLAKRLLDLGAEDAMAIGACMGTGPLVALPEDRLIVMDVRAEGTMGGIRAGEAALSNLPEAVRAQVDAWDPEGRARVLRPFYSAGEPVAGRRVWGARPARWQALEDKVVIDAFWDDAGIERAPYRVVSPAEVPEAARSLDAGAGTVWAGDAREGFNGGASYTRWVRDGRDAERALDFLAPRCDRVRVMPFLDGLPCSIHGIVAPGEEHILTLRPMEMLVLRGPEGFVYSGGAGLWRPAAEDRQAMRRVARRVGEHLRSAFGYRGAYTVDGVLTERGFLPSELNPRFGAALTPYVDEDIPLVLLVFAMVEGLRLDWRLEALEECLLQRSEEPKDTWCGLPMAMPVEEERTMEVVFDPLARPAREGEPPHAKVVLGPSSGGSYMRMGFLPDHTPVGPSLAPRVATLVELLRSRWGLPVGPLEPAPSLR